MPGPSAPAGLMGGFISAVLAGVAFFTGLACFFWEALADPRQQLASILQLLRGGDNWRCRLPIRLLPAGPGVCQREDSSAAP